MTVRYPDTSTTAASGLKLGMELSLQPGQRPGRGHDEPLVRTQPEHPSLTRDEGSVGLAGQF
jgi:hypothetical protein